jgi:hypothetical protein
MTRSLLGRGLALAASVLAGLACGPVSQIPATVTSTSTAPATPAATQLPVAAAPRETPVDPESWLRQRIQQVNADRLLADVVALSSIPTRHVNSPGIGAAAEYLAGAFVDAGVELDSDLFEMEFRGATTQQSNLVGVIPGIDLDAGAILLGAHYDSRTVDIGDWTGPAPGANDNATGVAVLLEVARLLADFRPRAAIYLVAFSAEETGLQGSRHLVEAGLPRAVSAVAIFDIVGNSSGPSGPNALRVFSAGPEGSDSRLLARWAADLGAAWVPELPVRVQDSLDRPGRYSDHVPFHEAGVAAVRFIEDGEHVELQHNPFDTADRVDPVFLRRVARLALALAVGLAGSGQVVPP